MKKCERCGSDLTFSLELVKEGRAYECWRCVCEFRVMSERALTRLGREILREGEVIVARLQCRNLYLFDRRVFHEFMRTIFRELREEPRSVLLNLAEVAYLPEMFFRSIVRLKRQLDRLGCRLTIVNGSAVFRHTLAGVHVDPEHVLFRSEAEAVMAARA
ncbi:MAG: STAS domain-containing protein [Planctomycetota bacterium]